MLKKFEEAINLCPTVCQMAEKVRGNFDMFTHAPGHKFLSLEIIHIWGATYQRVDGAGKAATPHILPKATRLQDGHLLVAHASSRMSIPSTLTQEGFYFTLFSALRERQPPLSLDFLHFYPLGYHFISFPAKRLICLLYLFFFRQVFIWHSIDKYLEFLFAVCGTLPHNFIHKTRRFMTLIYVAWPGIVTRTAVWVAKMPGRDIPRRTVAIESRIGTG